MALYQDPILKRKFVEYFYARYASLSILIGFQYFNQSDF